MNAKLVIKPATLPTAAAVYAIKNLIDGKIYVGSTVDANRRQRQHLWCLRHGCHENSRLQIAWDESGEDNFEFSILQRVLRRGGGRRALHAAEQKFLDRIRLAPGSSYNRSLDASCSGSWHRK